MAIWNANIIYNCSFILLIFLSSVAHRLSLNLSYLIDVGGFLNKTGDSQTWHIPKYKRAPSRAILYCSARLLLFALHFKPWDVTQKARHAKHQQLRMTLRVEPKLVA